MNGANSDIRLPARSVWYVAFLDAALVGWPFLAMGFAPRFTAIAGGFAILSAWALHFVMMASKGHWRFADAPDLVFIAATGAILGFVAGTLFGVAVGIGIDGGVGFSAIVGWPTGAVLALVSESLWRWSVSMGQE